MKEILTVPEAARIIGCPENKIRIRMKRNLWDLGTVIPPRDGKKVWTYEIILSKLEAFLGRKIVDEGCVGTTRRKEVS